MTQELSSLEGSPIVVNAEYYGKAHPGRPEPIDWLTASIVGIVVGVIALFVTLGVAQGIASAQGSSDLFWATWLPWGAIFTAAAFVLSFLIGLVLSRALGVAMFDTATL